MSLGLIIGIIGVLIGSLGIYLTLKYRRFPQITFVNEEVIPLFDSIVKNLPELQILYKNSPVKPNLVLIKGAFINTGKKDIEPTMIENPISIILPEDYKWVEKKVISTSQNMQADLKLNDNQTLILENGLFKWEEFIRFQALVEMPQDNNKGDILGQILMFNHRIAEMEEIQNIELEKIEIAKGRFIETLLGVSVIITMFLLGIGGVYLSTENFSLQNTSIAIMTTAFGIGSMLLLVLLLMEYTKFRKSQRIWRIIV